MENGVGEVSGDPDDMVGVLHRDGERQEDVAKGETMSESFIAQARYAGDPKKPSIIVTIPVNVVQFLKLKKGEYVRLTVEKA
jgi:hypothetical protein